MIYLLDTHTWIWWNMRPQHLSEKIKSKIGDTNQYNELLLSAISLWEFCKLLEKEKIGISCDPLKWLEIALQMPKLRIVPLTSTIAYRSTILPKPFHNDPADQIIVATAIVENAVILTKDERIHSYKHVQSLW